MAGISFKNLSKSYGALVALRDVSLEIEEGEFVALIGPSGCGKTTMLRHVLGLEVPTSGTVRLGGEPPEQARAARDLGFVAQKAALVPSLTAVQNVELTLEITKARSPLTPRQLLEDFGLGQFLHHHPHKLSGGMQQRVNIAAAIVHNPHYLLMDEPFGALDEMTKESMAEWLRDVLARNPKTSILVTHSIDEAVTLADRIVILRPRPGEIETVVKVDLPRSRPRQIKTSQAFSDIVMEVRRHLYSVES